MKDLLKRSGMDNAKIKSTHMSLTIKFGKDKKGKEVNIKKYRGIIGSLLYLTVIDMASCLLYVYNQDFNHVPRNLICSQ